MNWARGEAGLRTREVGTPAYMPKPSSDLVLVVALVQTLIEALERLDDPIASEAPVEGLRSFCNKAEAKLELRATGTGG